jgi:hypothetical protein
VSADKDRLKNLPSELKNLHLEPKRHIDFELNTDPTDTFRRVDIYDGKYD